MTPAKQVDYWSLLLKPLIYLDKGNVSTSITFGCSALHNTVNMDNFLVSDIFYIIVCNACCYWHCLNRTPLH